MLQPQRKKDQKSETSAKPLRNWLSKIIAFLYNWLIVFPCNWLLKIIVFPYNCLNKIVAPPCNYIKSKIPILDRYIIGSLILSYVICMGSIIGFYIIIELFEKFGKIVKILELKNKVGQHQHIISYVFFYYLYRTPLILYNLTPIITLMAAMFTLTKMSRSRELIPLKASGIPMSRLIIPFILFAVFISLLMFALQETVIPKFAVNIASSAGEVRKGDRRKINLQYCDNNGQIFYIGILHPPIFKAKHIRITILDIESKNFRVKRVIEAQEGYWLPEKEKEKKELVFKKGKIYDYLPDGNIVFKDIPDSGYKFKVISKIISNLEQTKEPTTDMVVRKLIVPGKKYLETLSLNQLEQLLQKNPKAADLRVTYHGRITTPLSNILLLFLGLPLVLRRNNKNLFLGAGICIITAAAFYSFNILCLNLGNREVLNPVFAAWLPIVTFGSIGIAMMTNLD